MIQELMDLMVVIQKKAKLSKWKRRVVTMSKFKVLILDRNTTKIPTPTLSALVMKISMKNMKQRIVQLLSLTMK